MSAADPLAPMPPLRRPLAWLLAALVAGYRRVFSPLLPPACRFHPSCSQYALLALHAHPVYRAVPLIVWRLLRCQPLCAGGVDFPPAGRFGPTDGTLGLTEGPACDSHPHPHPHQHPVP